MGPHYYYEGWSMGWIWALLNFLFWAAFIGLIIWTVLRLTRSGPPVPPRTAVGFAPPGPHGSPREILDRRYAAGEIDAATYDDMRARLEGAGPAAASQSQAEPSQ